MVRKKAITSFYLDPGALVKLASLSDVAGESRSGTMELLIELASSNEAVVKLLNEEIFKREKIRQALAKVEDEALARRKKKLYLASLYCKIGEPALSEIEIEAKSMTEAKGEADDWAGKEIAEMISSGRISEGQDLRLSVTRIKIEGGANA